MEFLYRKLKRNCETPISLFKAACSYHPQIGHCRLKLAMFPSSEKIHREKNLATGHRFFTRQWKGPRNVLNFVPFWGDNTQNVEARSIHLHFHLRRSPSSASWSWPLTFSNRSANKLWFRKFQDTWNLMRTAPKSEENVKCKQIHFANGWPNVQQTQSETLLPPKRPSFWSRMGQTVFNADVPWHLHWPGHQTPWGLLRGSRMEFTSIEKCIPSTLQLKCLVGTRFDTNSCAFYHHKLQSNCLNATCKLKRHVLHGSLESKNWRNNESTSSGQASRSSNYRVFAPACQHELHLCQRREFLRNTHWSVWWVAPSK